MDKIENHRVPLASELGKLIIEFRNHLRQAIQIRLKEHRINMTFEMLEVMSCLWSKDGINQQELADWTLRDKSSMTYLIDNLVKRHMVKRMEDEKDRRNKLIHVTEKGLKLKELLHPWVTEVYQAATVEVEAPALSSSIELFQKMIDSLKQRK